MTQRYNLHKFSSRLVAVLALAVLGTLNLAAQSISGDITGFVADPSGSGIANAEVTAENQETGVKSTTTSGSDGTFLFRNLSVGLYTVSASAPNFAPASVRDLQVQLNKRVAANLTLQVGSASTTVEVTGAPPPIDTTTAQLSTVFESYQLTELPTAGFSKVLGASGIWNLSLLGAGVSSQGGVGQGTGPSIAGQRPENNTFAIDGISNNDHFVTGPLVAVSNEAVAEVSVLQNQFSAEFGGASGGVFNAIVKGGTNQMHGTLYEYFQNRNLNALDSIYWTQGIRSLPRFDSNRFGGSVGGAIVKNRLFYFGNWEYNPVGQSAVPGQPVSTPTAAGFTALGGIQGLSRTNLEQFQKYTPVASRPSGQFAIVQGVRIPLGDVEISAPSFYNSQNAVTSIDYHMSEKDEFRGRWFYNRQRGVDSSPALPVFYGTLPYDNYAYSLSQFHTFSPTMQNEFRASFSRNNQAQAAPAFTYPGLDAFPNITIDELGLTLGPSGPSGSIQNLFQLANNISKVAGRHTIKAGYRFTDIILTSYFIQRVRGDYEYNELSQFLRDRTPDVLGERSGGPKSIPAGFLDTAGFVNDDFRIRPNLTLNLGLRYEFVTVPVASRAQKLSAIASVPGGITFAEPMPNKKEFSPRLGFAWSPGNSGNWSVRGGVGRSFNISYANLTANAAPPFYQQTLDVDLNEDAPNFLAGGGLKGGAVPLPTDVRAHRAIIGSYTYGGQRPYGLTWTLGVQRVIAKNYTVEVRYVGTKGVHLWNQTRYNIASRVNESNFIPTYFSQPSAATLAGLTRTLGQVRSYIVPGGTAARPFDFLASQGFAANIVGYSPQAVSSYHGLAIQVNRRMSNNFGYVLAFTWSHLLDNATATNFSTQLTPRRAQDFQNLNADWSSSALDRRYRLTFTPTYDFQMKNGNWMMKNVVGNWKLNGTWTLEAPEYATVQSNADSNLNNDTAGDRTVINPAGSAMVGSDVIALNSAGQTVGLGNPGIVAYVARDPNARYVRAQLGAIANSGRNTLPLKRTNNIDLALSKRFNFGETRYVEFSGQFFNVLNHAQYTGGYLSDVSRNGYTASRNSLIPGNPNFTRFDLYYSSNSRAGQLVLKLHF